VQILTRSGFRQQSWKNGQGTTWEICVENTGLPDNDFTWRLSLAQILRSCAFSRFPGIRRTILRVGGGPMTLRFADGTSHRLDETFAPFEFAGDAGVSCELDGPAAYDLNLMVRDSHARYGMSVLHFSDQLELRCAPEETVLAFLGAPTLVSHAPGVPARCSAWDAVRLDGEETAVLAPAEQSTHGLAFVAHLHGIR
jgi:uncharacterized protein